MPRVCCAAAVLALLAGCSSAPQWAKAGADESAAAEAERDCRALAAAAVEPEIGINQDILATRGADWRRSQIRDVQTRAMRAQTSDRAAAIVASCMRAKGFAPAP